MQICDEDEKEFLLQKIRASSARTRLGVALRYENRELSKVAMKELKDTKFCQINDRVGYNHLNNRVAYFYWRVIRKIMHAFRGERES